jgi:hypothetical protein
MLILRRESTHTCQMSAPSTVHWSKHLHVHAHESASLNINAIAWPQPASAFPWKTIFLHFPFVGWGSAAYYRRKTCNLMHTNAGTHQNLAKHVNARWWVGEKNTREGWGQTAPKAKIAYYGTLKETLYQEADKREQRLGQRNPRRQRYISNLLAWKVTGNILCRSSSVSCNMSNRRKRLRENCEVWTLQNKAYSKPCCQWEASDACWWGCCQSTVRLPAKVSARCTQ